MDPFAYFQHLKPAIEAETQTMQNLRTYGFGDPYHIQHLKTLDFLGKGRNNMHFRIVKVGDVWLATREDLSDFYWESDRSVCECYIRQAVQAHKQGHKVPRLCGSVIAHFSRERGDRYFLLLEDLTRGGTSDFVPAPRSGGVAGTLSGEPIHHDFDTLEDSNFDHTFSDDYWRYTKPDYVLHLRE